jgi:hypothetical protein
MAVAWRDIEQWVARIWSSARERPQVLLLLLWHIGVDSGAVFDIVGLTLSPLKAVVFLEAFWE